MVLTTLEVFSFKQTTFTSAVYNAIFQEVDLFRQEIVWEVRDYSRWCSNSLKYLYFVFLFQQAFGEICLLWLNITGCVYTFYPINKVAAGLMLPYLGWVTLATALKYTIWQMNKPSIKAE